MRLSTTALALVITLTACGDKDGDGGEDSAAEATDGADGADAGDGTDGADGTSDALVLPEEGTWSSTPIDVLSDTCGGVLDNDDGVTIVITVTGADAFVMSDPDGELNFNCRASAGGGFACEPFTEVREYGSSGVDATTTLEVQYSGAFSSPESGSLLIDLSLTCEGPDCDLLGELIGAALPCGAQGAVDLTFTD